jgi:catechol 2,3-dioxygenase
MPLPVTNLEPAFNITRASHVVFTARDLAASRAFYTEVLGLIVSDEDRDTIWFRGVEEGCHHSLTLKRTTGPAACEQVGFRVFRDEDLERAKAYFDHVGARAVWADVPYQGRTLHVSDAPERRSNSAHAWKRGRACTPSSTSIKAGARCGWIITR